MLKSKLKILFNIPLCGNILNILVEENVFLLLFCLAFLKNPEVLMTNIQKWKETIADVANSKRHQ